MEFNYITILALSGAFIAGMGIQYLLSFRILPHWHAIYVWWFRLRNHKKYGEPCKTDKTFDRDGYSLGYSYQNKTAMWVSYIISKASIGVDVPRENEFYPDPDVPEKYRVTPDDYRNSGYDKGHFAPSAAIDFSRRANNQTFAMSNIIFQNPKLNRQAWSGLEAIIRKWTHSKGKLYVVTGPVYGQRSKRVNGIAVPRALYKVIYSIKYKKTIAFLFPNKEISSRDIWKYAVSVKELEKETSMKFLSKVSRSRKIKNDKDFVWWQRNDVK